MNLFRPLKAGEVPELPGSLHTMPDRVRVALPTYISYTADTGVLLWVCTECRKALSYWLLCCACLKPLHEDCSYVSFDSVEFIGERDYMCKKYYLELKELGELMRILTFSIDYFFYR
jgi:hypothetical protein